MRSERRPPIVRAILLALTLAVTAGPLVAAQPLRVVLDPGHTAAQGGALGVHGVYEVRYNDRLAGQVFEALKAAGIDVRLTHAAGQEISLPGRAQFANDLHADLFLSIHHDSAQPKYLEKTRDGELDAYRTIKPIGGYSIFVSRLNPAFTRSYAFARMLGEEMRRLGRTPATHHAEAIPGENREWLNAQLGIYRFDDLIVLKKTEVPAALLEVGVIVDPTDEAWVSRSDNQAHITQAIVTAVQRYASECRPANCPAAQQGQ